MRVLVTCKNEDDRIKNEGARVFTRFLPLSVYGDFSRCQRAANSAVHGPIWPNFELVRDVMDVLITCQYEEDPIKNRGARVFTILYINFSDAQEQITLKLVVVSGRNLSKRSCMSLLPARMRMIDSKMKELWCSQDFSHYKSMGIFPDAQGQLTPQSLVRSGRISNSSEMLWMLSLPASTCMKKIRSRMKALECSQHFPHYNHIGAIRCHGHQSSDPIWPTT